MPSSYSPLGNLGDIGDFSGLQIGHSAQEVSSENVEYRIHRARASIQRKAVGAASPSPLDIQRSQAYHQDSRGPSRASSLPSELELSHEVQAPTFLRQTTNDSGHETRHLITDDPEHPRGLAREFNPRRQLVRLLSIGLCRFLITAALLGGLYGAIYYYKKKPYMDSHSDKRMFNFYTTALSMLLGISIASAFKQVALDIRWRILSRKKRNLRQVDGILQMDSLTNLAFMGLERLKKGRFAGLLGLAVWIVINLGAQAGVAMIALTYSLDPITVINPSSIGPVQVKDLSTYFPTTSSPNASDPSFIASNRLTAHMYGQGSINYQLHQIPYTDPANLPITPLTLKTSNASDYFEAQDYTQYIFQQWSLSSSTSQTPIGQFFSNRSIAATSTCTTYNVTAGADGKLNQITFNNATGQLTTRDFKKIQPLSTTYYINPTQGAELCGPRCQSLCAFENNGQTGFYYECNVTLSPVLNAYMPQHNLSDAQARVAAGSIAWEGYEETDAYANYQRFPATFPYGKFLGGNNESMAKLVRQFAVATVVGMDQNNAFTAAAIEGETPTQGLTITIDHPGRLYALLLVIGAVQLVLFVVGALWANGVVVLDESYLVVGRLMAPLVRGVSGKGSLFDGKEIAEVLEKDRGEKSEKIAFMYGTMPVVGGRSLGIAEDVVERTFPRGWYV